MLLTCYVPTCLRTNFFELDPKGAIRRSPHPAITHHTIPPPQPQSQAVAVALAEAIYGWLTAVCCIVSGVPALTGGLISKIHPFLPIKKFSCGLEISRCRNHGNKVWTHFEWTDTFLEMTPIPPKDSKHLDLDSLET